ncbi:MULTISPECIES: CpsD/CapB family tyrosine-protein kinase [Clostridia]|uniref:non-specific protein-tyrosine kinase n=2 Tax=Clostridia TaxID=186801 RepID=A0A8I0DKE0_9CLOT|nr:MULTISPECIES: CpsD/CapB family tyrosine-protein kinase [Clostridia]MBC5638993.1 CpsD/CapB family tyrosine-protein kinase [Clostridium lentum]MBC5653086.1 CpsD/CapB family tyrosine-protein kinase [Blautia lenta]
MFVMEKAPKSIDAEAYRSLRSNIEYSSFDDEYRAIVVTSSVPGEGKSTTSGNLALSLAQSGNKVLLVDCDMRKPSIHKKFKISNISGTAELLLRKESFEDVANCYNENLTIITAGKIPPNPSEMLSSRAMAAFIKEMKNEFKYIILDTPPLQAVTDAQVLSTKSDGVLLVVRAGSTKREMVLNSVDLIKKVHGKIIGTVLNGVENKKNNYYYYGE